MKIWLGALTAALTLVGSAQGSYTVEPTLTRVAGAETRCHAVQGDFDAYVRLFGFADGGTALYQPGDPPLIHLSPKICAGLQALAGGWRPDGRNRATLGLVLYVFSREVAHTIIRDPIHGQPGHDDQRASCIGYRRMGLLAIRLGITDRDYRVALRADFRALGLYHGHPCAWHQH